MKKFLDSLERVLSPMAKKIGENKYLIAIRDGFLLSTPVLIVGSFFLLIANFPLNQWDSWMSAILGKEWASHMMVPASASFDVMTILAVAGIAYSLARQFDEDAMQAAIISLVAFFIVTPYTTFFTPENTETVYEVTSLPLKWMGSSGLFLGMITALVATRLFVWVVRKGWKIKMPDSVPPTVSKSFEALIPSFVIIFVFFIIDWLATLTSYGSLQDIIFNLLQIPLLSLGNTLGAMIVAYLFLHFFWFFGINGSSVVGAVFNPVLRALSMENLEAYKAHTEIPNIITGQFQDMFATFGGAGSTLSLVIVMVLFCKSQRIKKLSQLSIVPSFFGINEPIIFGLPIVLNPIILVPFVLVPTINIIIAYFAMSWGLVPFTNGIQLPWTTPIVFSGFLVSGWQGAVLQVLLLLLGMVIYYPFVKMMDRQYLEEEKNYAEELEDDINFEDFDFDAL
ncbi:PTS cellobiose transporter subunit IIC [Vagococcus bubulae]|uniref:Permease IIC component n=1 Tax=Vagococcus bubulae TaxID=1977868 RepID=A0A429ZFG4_9ENTE|nr:PTS cellobiose transporter subunit IIC [Vagococcus bubulae]RST92420.1 PTS system, cellobiose-specific IIC component [Vagococcus bubulae]